MKTEACGYIRVSTERQANKGVSLEAQEGKIRAWCTASGCTLAGLHVDAGLSGGKMDNRPALQAALAAVTRARGVLVVYSLSRLARSTRDTIQIAEQLEKADADLVSLSEKIDTTNAAGRMIFRMLAVFAEFTRDQTAEQTRGALAHLRMMGKRISRHIPYGYSLSGHDLTQVESEQAVIADMARMRGEGYCYGRIAASLTERGVASKRGGVWTPATVSRILSRGGA